MPYSLGNADRQKVNLESKDFQPRENSILVTYKEPEKEVKSETGIVLEMQRSTLERPIQGKVVQKGTSEDLDWIDIGEEVVWTMTDGVLMEMNDGLFLLLRETSVLGKVKSTTAP